MNVDMMVEVEFQKKKQVLVTYKPAGTDHEIWATFITGRTNNYGAPMAVIELCNVEAKEFDLPAFLEVDADLLEHRKLF